MWGSGKRRLVEPVAFKADHGASTSTQERAGEILPSVFRSHGPAMRSTATGGRLPMLLLLQVSLLPPWELG